MTTRAVARGAGRGALGAMVMSAVRTVTTGFGLVEQTPPDAVFREGAPRVMAQVPPERRQAVVELMHWVYGLVGGALYAALPDRLRRPSWSGPVYGLLLWLTFEIGWAPVLGLARQHHRRPVERLVLAADHTLYGWVLSPPRR
ncbi:MAG TPA: hypothetical protein VIL00_03140 [Pseudonocardiaceae bacterium]